jgi:hypothetical protein
MLVGLLKSCEKDVKKRRGVCITLRDVKKRGEYSRGIFTGEVDNIQAMKTRRNQTEGRGIFTKLERLTTITTNLLNIII